jgi:hypothetical protein
MAGNDDLENMWKEAVFFFLEFAEQTEKHR